MSITRQVLISRIQSSLETPFEIFFQAHTIEFIHILSMLLLKNCILTI